MSENVFEQGEYTERKNIVLKLKWDMVPMRSLFIALQALGIFTIYYAIWRVVMNFCVNKVLLTKSTIAFYFVT